MANNFDKFAILDSFLDEVQSYLPEIQAFLDRLQQHPGDMDTIEETYRRTHTIAGSAAMMEFAGLAHVAQGMEDTLGEALDNQTPLDVTTIGLMRRSYGRLSRLIENIKTGAEDGPVVADDDADRASARGASGAAGAAQSGYGGFTPSQAAPTDFAASQHGGGAAPPSSPSLQIPDWLAAFAAPGGELGSGPSAPFGPAAGGQQPPATPAASGMATNGWDAPAAQPAAHDPFAASLSNMQAGQYAAPPPRGQTPEPAEPSFDDILQSFQAPSEDSAFAPPPGSYAPHPMAPSTASESWAAPGTPPTNPAWQQSQPYAPNAGWPAASQSSLRSPQPPTSADQWGQPPVGSQNLGWQSSNVGNPQQGWAASRADAFAQSDLAAQGTAALPVASQSAQPSADLQELRQDEDAIRRQVATLRDVAAAIHEAAVAMEDERSELRSFLDGSRDALERLEEWAGQQMGLDLRQSPEAVRRYLPLSVIWVTTTRLKKLATLLTSSGRAVTTTEEQIEETLNELRTALNNVGQLYGSVRAFGAGPDGGFSATVAQVTWNPPAATPPASIAPSVDSAASSAALSAERALSPGARAELERGVREQLRRELEDDVRAEVAAELRRDEEDRIRQEIQIQVRRQLLAELTPGFGSSNMIQMGGTAQVVLPQMASVAERAPKPVRVTSEQSPEALEVFRDEAQEHLQSITTGLAQLERNPGDTPVLQSVRRAMHTLKGAAGMMGFTRIQQTAHASEDLLDKMVEDQATLTSEVLSLLLDTSEALDLLVTGAATMPEDEQDLLVRSLMTRYTRYAGNESAIVDESSSSGQHDATQVALADDAEDLPEQKVGATANDLSVRLQLSKLDDLVNLFGELLINRSVLEERVDRLNRLVGDAVVVGERLRDVGSQLDTRFEAATLPSGRGTTGTLVGGSGGRDGAGGWAAGARQNGSGGLRPDMPSFANEFDELELDRYTEFHRLSRGLSEGVADMVTLGHEMEAIIRDTQASFARENRLSSDFQDRLLKARLVPLESLIPRLYRATRASALREGKEIEFFAEGASTEVDRKVFEEVAGPLLHLVRNSVNHGIERPNVRELAGKPRAGKITVSAAYEGNQVVISVADDGGGIDPEKIRATAIAKGWIDPYTHLSEKEAINLIFRSGVSTAEALTEESGRGVGLDVVRDSVTRLRGSIEVDSTVGQGTQFTLKFPISLQIARAVLVKVGGQTVAIPMAVVDQIGRLDYYQRTSGPAPAIEMRGEQYPLVHLASYLKLTPGPVDDRSSILLVNAGKRRVALLVDSIAAQQEVVSKPLGPHLRDVPGVAGAAVLGNGQVILILELLELLAQQPRGEVVLPEPGAKPSITMEATSPIAAMRTSVTPGSLAAAPGSTTTAPHVPRPPAPTISQREFVVAPRPTDGPGQRIMAPPSAQKSFVLVVDDSPSVRRVVSNMLKAHGWEVQTARDGVEALEVIARELPAAVLLDIEMPRMDGYELMATVRSQDQYRRLPLIVLTSRAATKHQQRAMQLGADAYVVKPYQDEDLLTTIATLVQTRQ